MWGNLAPLPTPSLCRTIYQRHFFFPAYHFSFYHCTHYSVMSDSDEEYTIPLQDQRAFGAGLKRKRIQFICSSDTTSTAINNSATPYSRSVSKTYLDLVIPQSSDSFAAQNSKSDAYLASTDQQICDTCSLPIPPLRSSTHHAALLAHQLSLPHSHPPSALPHDRTGVRLLRAKGWDPDARIGLGAKGQGIRFPIKAKEKNDKLGIGASIPKPKHDRPEVSRAIGQEKYRKEKENDRGKNGKGWLKKSIEKEKQRSNKLQELFYESEEVSKYLR